MIKVYLIRHSKTEKTNNFVNSDNLQLQNEKQFLSIDGELLAENKGLSKQLKSIDDYFNELRELKQFKRDVFEKMIECIIVGDYDDNGYKLPRVARFVLKTGKEYKFTIPPKNNSKNDKNELVPFDTGNVSCFNCTSKSNLCSFASSFNFLLAN